MCVAVGLRGHGERRDVGAGLRLRQREGRDRLAVAHRRQIACASIRREPNSEIEPVPSPCMAKAKSASPSRKPRISRARQSVRTSSFGCSPPCASGTTAFSNPASPSAFTRARQASSTSSCGSDGQHGIGPARQLPSAKRAMAVSKNGQREGIGATVHAQLPFEHRLLLRGEGADRRARNPPSPCTAPAPPPRPRSRSRPTSPIPSPACAWSWRWRRSGPSARSRASFVASASTRLGRRQPVEKAPALGLLAAHGCGR